MLTTKHQVGAYANDSKKMDWTSRVTKSSTTCLTVHKNYTTVSAMISDGEIKHKTHRVTEGAFKP